MQKDVFHIELDQDKVDRKNYLLNQMALDIEQHFLPKTEAGKSKAESRMERGSKLSIKRELSEKKDPPKH